jgi:hypothetical protein
MGIPVCGSQMQTPPPSWSLRRRPVCNRVPAHDGAHREYDKRTFAVRAEWTDEEVRVS